MPSKTKKAMTPQPQKGKRLSNQLKTPRSVPPPKRKALQQGTGKDPKFDKAAVTAKLFGKKPQKAGSESDDFDSDDEEEEMTAPPAVKAGQKRKGQPIQKADAKKSPKVGKTASSQKSVTPAKTKGAKNLSQDSDEDEDDDDDDSDDEDIDDSDESEDGSEENDILGENKADESESDDDDESDVEQKIEDVITKKMNKPTNKKGKPLQENKPVDSKVSQKLSSEEKGRQDERNKKTLFVKRLPRDVTVADVENLSMDIIDVRLATSKKACKGYAFIEFKNEKVAEKNYKALQKSELKSKKLFVDYVGEKSQRGGSKAVDKTETPEKFDPSKLYVTGFPRTCVVADLKKLFPKSNSIDLPKRKKDKVPLGYAFVKFSSPTDAKQAYETKSDYTVKGQSLIVLYAKLRTEKPKGSNTAKKSKKDVKKTPAAKTGKEVKVEADDSESDDDDDDDDEDDDEMDSDDDDESDDDEDDDDDNSDDDDDDDDDD